MRNAVLGLISETGNRSCIFSLWRDSRVDTCEGNLQHGVRTVSPDESVNRVIEQAKSCRRLAEKRAQELDLPLPTKTENRQGD